VPAFTPRLQLETLFVLDDEGRIVSTREPNATAGPAFSLIRDRHGCACAVHADVSSRLAGELMALARSEPPAERLTDPPTHAATYVRLLGDRVDFGPVFTFAPSIDAPVDVEAITDVSQLEQHFRGWTASEIPGCSPIVGVFHDGYPVSVCFCARRSAEAAEAGVETAADFRRRGLATRVTAAWARAIQDSGRLPLYSTSWNNAASIAVARRLGASACASDWNLY
jgi:RimJ/RimL family protein N-acetyltransferase